MPSAVCLRSKLNTMGQGCSNSEDKSASAAEPTAAQAETIVTAPRESVDDSPTSIAQQPQQSHADELLRAEHDIQAKYPLHTRALSMPTLLHLVGKAWPKGRMRTIPQLHDLPDTEDGAPRGPDGRPLTEMFVWEVVKYYIVPGTEAAKVRRLGC